MSPPRLALVTCDALRELTEDDRPLLGELWARGIKAEPVVWDDPGVDWSVYDAVLIRSAWDYHLKAVSFRAWLARLDFLGVPSWNPTEVVRANIDKYYLKRLEAAGVSVVPTLWVPQGARERADDLLAVRGWDQAVIKPAISAGAYRTARVRRGAAQAALDEVLLHSDAMVQSYLAEIAAEGEWSFIFLGGEFSHAVLKTPREGDFRVQVEYGGRAVGRPAPPELLTQAREAAIVAPGPWLYARVDGVRRGKELVVIEVELIEPVLYLSCAPSAAGQLASAVAGLIAKKLSTNLVQTKSVDNSKKARLGPA
jgi:glutathione synthase/RimK-type ligase-like ATP-grasp enzyme